MPTGLSPLSPADIAKRTAAARALEFVESGMIVGLGTGSTAAWFVRLLSERIEAEGLEITGVATSSTTAWLARDLGIPLKTPDDAGRIDLTIDGTDEFDPRLDLVKGGGAALLQEKIVASASARMMVIADPAKRVATLGAFPLPVEVVRFGCLVTQAAVERELAHHDLGGTRSALRVTSGKPLVTDEGNHILDLHLGRIADPPRLARALSVIPGVVEHGLFVGMADAVVVGHENGEAELIRRHPPPDFAEQMRNEDA
jgi:ribose 5-phosphate isomerase A